MYNLQRLTMKGWRSAQGSARTGHVRRNESAWWSIAIPWSMAAAEVVHGGGAGIGAIGAFSVRDEMVDYIPRELMPQVRYTHAHLNK